MTRLSFFIGKGGVGKTTVAAAYAVRSALRTGGARVLLLSTDPAHSLADILQQNLGSKASAVPLPSRRKLIAWQVDTQEYFRTFLNKYKQPLLSILESGSIFSREDLEPLMDTALPGMAEMSGLLAIHDALSSQKYQQIVVDTAPLGHTLRLFELPEHFQRFVSFLDLAGSRDRVLAEHFGGRAQTVGSQMLERWQTMADDVRQALQDAELFLVTTAEEFSLNESLRARDILLDHSPPLEIRQVVLNRAVVGASKCPACRKKASSSRKALAVLRQEFSGVQIRMAEDKGAPVLGAEALAAFGDHVFEGRRVNWKAPSPRAADIRMAKTGWPLLATPLSLVVGKGGVGKTTISAALGFHLRSKTAMPVEVCSVDPAPSLDDVFQAEIGDEAQPVLDDAKFRASEMDSVRLFRQWVAEVKDVIEEATVSERSGLHVDLSFERQLFTELLEIVPPGVDEIFAILRISELLAGRSKRVVIDTAPTGHALELLRTPERILTWTRLLLKTLAAHRTLGFARDAGVKVAELGHRVRELSDRLKDPKHTRVYTVMLPEALPDRETGRLVRDLAALRLAPKSLFINRVIFPDSARQCRRCQVAYRWQQATLAELKRRYPKKVLHVVRDFPEEIAGKRGLQSFTGELWRLR